MSLYWDSYHIFFSHFVFNLNKGTEYASQTTLFYDKQGVAQFTLRTVLSLGPSRNPKYVDIPLSHLNRRFNKQIISIPSAHKRKEIKNENTVTMRDDDLRPLNVERGLSDPSLVLNPPPSAIDVTMIPFDVEWTRSFLKSGPCDLFEETLNEDDIFSVLSVENS